ncbi:hypothetical protein BC826DRAFT_973511 [Russula brevipes]|nr:hypothetical protein BC826DRAFT_973511 [Russula brevipes]
MRLKKRRWMEDAPSTSSVGGAEKGNPSLMASASGRTGCWSASPRAARLRPPLSFRAFGSGSGRLVDAGWWPCVNVTEGDQARIQTPAVPTNPALPSLRVFYFQGTTCRHEGDRAAHFNVAIGCTVQHVSPGCLWFPGRDRLWWHEIGQWYEEAVKEPFQLAREGATASWTLRLLSLVFVYLDWAAPRILRGS